jgi:hypothetical protein
MPEIDFSALRKILEVEQKKGFSDSTVFGGLDKFIRQWTEKTLEAVAAPSVLVKIQKLGLKNSNYAAMTVKEREAWIKEVRKFADELEHGKTPKPAPVRKISVTLEKPVLKPKTQAIASGQQLDASITTIKGISTSFAAKFGKLGVKNDSRSALLFPQPPCRLQPDENRFPAARRTGRNHRR